MWVYQETKTNAAALVPTLPEDTAGESLAEKEAITPASGRLEGMPPQKAPRRKPFQASRDCILLAAAYLFGTLMAGVLQALCDVEEMETLAYYLDCWRGVFAASSAAQAVGLFGGRAGCRPRGGGSVPPAGALGSGAAAHLSVCDVIRDRLRPALGTASE